MYDIQQAKSESRELLQGYLTHVPPAVRDGSYNLAVEFKKAVSAARRVHDKRNASQRDVVAAINNLDRFWRA
jgi:hypothetical protein